jgi:hypothetical protein
MSKQLDAALAWLFIGWIFGGFAGGLLGPAAIGIGIFGFVFLVAIAIPVYQWGPRKRFIRAMKTLREPL